ncbi:hypothetical protein V8D89_000140 [Ganoderma adspersum]
MAILLPGWSMVIALISGLRPLAFSGIVLLGAGIGAMFYTNSAQRCAHTCLSCLQPPVVLYTRRSIDLTCFSGSRMFYNVVYSFPH